MKARRVPTLGTYHAVFATMKTVLGSVACVLSLASPAHAEETPPLSPNRSEVGVLPAIAYDSDLGLGFGAVGSLARFDEGYAPYRWRLAAQTFFSARLDEDDDVDLPFQAHYVSLDMPGLAGGPLRIQANVAFGRFTRNGYYGLRGESEEREDRGELYHFYDRVFPSGLLNFRLEVMDHLELLLGANGSYNWMNPYPGSKLLEDADALRGLEDHLQLAANVGVLLDTRDHEFAPTRGTFTEVSSRLSPSGDELSYGTLYLSSQWFAPLYEETLVFAGRIAADAIFGDAPVYELRNFGVLDRTAGPGGTRSVRGVNLHRYHDKRKLIANAELRANAPWGDVIGERMRLGGVAFADVGRVTGTTTVGVGSGLRLQWGETFIIRGDVGYAPIEDTLGIYIDVGHVF